MAEKSVIGVRAIKISDFLYTIIVAEEFMIKYHCNFFGEFAESKKKKTPHSRANSLTFQVRADYLTLVSHLLASSYLITAS